MLGSLLMRVQCHRVTRVLQSYLDGEVEPPTATAVAEHLEMCRRCGLEADTYVAIKTAIAAGEAGRVHADPEAVDRLRDFARSLAGGPPDDEGG